MVKSFDNCCFRAVLYVMFALLIEAGYMLCMIPATISLPSSYGGYDYSNCPAGAECMMPMIASYSNDQRVYIYEGWGVAMVIAGVFGILLTSIAACLQKVCCCHCLERRL